MSRVLNDPGSLPGFMKWLAMSEEEEEPGGTALPCEAILNHDTLSRHTTVQIQDKVRDGELRDGYRKLTVSLD
jgi:hypothetical protein